MNEFNFNFNVRQKKYLNIILPDAKQTKLTIGTPTKSIMDALMDFAEKSKDIEGAAVSSEVIDNLYEICAKVLSRNTKDIKFTTEQLADMLDFEDLFAFYSAYMQFVAEATTAQKN